MDLMDRDNGKQQVSHLIEVLLDDGLIEAVIKRERLKVYKSVVKSIWGLNETTLETCELCENKDVVLEIRHGKAEDKVKICISCLDKTKDLIDFLLEYRDNYLKDKVAD